MHFDALGRSWEHPRGVLKPLWFSYGPKKLQDAVQDTILEVLGGFVEAKMRISNPTWAVLDAKLEGLGGQVEGLHALLRFYKQCKSVQ